MYQQRIPLEPSAGPETAYKLRVAEGNQRRGITASLLEPVFDRTFAAVALFAVTPLILLLCLLLKLTQGGPVFYAHNRLGKGGKTFPCYKFRTMAQNADQRLEQVLRIDPIARAEWEQRQKLDRDPRVHKLGAFLRKTSLDEIPQFWNVLVGHMSIVGPRPITRDEAHHYGADLSLCLSVKPGITGIWQVSGRSNTTYAERVALDVGYVKNLRLWTDIKIILKTVFVVLNQSDAR
ncbi:sugar transferase [Shimia abyssi]|uniref:Lipopolysaccharide/colanic/teichoic acid biosynthesis glycosyltransferase n=1 Tax=Shimia abyssi TaxID=1662395 RepID=A0A2P8F9S3_9RHOB|nr:sugar transferase [Shimia abyssi]PSL18460.1 lipopolysaccharide/colanic/teichoic acid biosynthesis glycosyltransferase [Shimia abyssi]